MVTSHLRSREPVALTIECDNVPQMLKMTLPIKFRTAFLLFFVALFLFRGTYRSITTSTDFGPVYIASKVWQNGGNIYNQAILAAKCGFRGN